MADMELESWECFCDMAYFDKWAVRNKNDRAFTSAIHVETYDEAQEIVDKFNLVEAQEAEIKRLREAEDLLKWIYDKYAHLNLSFDDNWFAEAQDYLCPVGNIAQAALKKGE